MGKTAFAHALITGGSSGIGYAIAQQLVRNGTDVTIAARNTQRLEEASRRLKEIAHEHAVVETLSLDVADEQAVNESVNLLHHRQMPDLIVNAAGYVMPGYFSELDRDSFDMTMKINVTGIWNVLSVYTPLMPEGSTIVNISSFSGLLGTFGYSSYAASKYAVIGLSEALRNELSPRNIRVTVLCPPDTDTPQLAEENRHKPPETKALSGKAGLLSPEFVAASLFRGLKKGKFIIIPGLQSRLIYLLKRLFPSIVYAMIDSTIRKVRNNQ